MINDQGLNSLKVLANLEEKEITSLCKLCRKPGGTVEANQTQRRNQGSQSIPNPGVPVALIHENNLKLAVFYLKYLVMTSRPLDVDRVSMRNLQGIQDFKKRIDNMENPCPTTAPKLTNKDMFEFFGDFRDFLSDNIGPLSKRPLSYVVREHDAVQQHLGDLEFGRLGSPYKSHIHEIENRAPIKQFIDGTLSVFPDHHFTSDNKIVWKVLYGITKSTNYYSYIKEYAQARDGRAAFIALKYHLLGTDAINNRAS